MVLLVFKKIQFSHLNLLLTINDEFILVIINIIYQRLESFIYDYLRVITNSSIYMGI